MLGLVNALEFYFVNHPASKNQKADHHNSDRLSLESYLRNLYLANPSTRSFSIASAAVLHNNCATRFKLASRLSVDSLCL